MLPWKAQQQKKKRWHSHKDWFWQLEFVAWVLRSHLLNPVYMPVLTCSYVIKHFCKCSASQHFSSMYIMKASCSPENITANVKSLMQLHTYTHKEFLAKDTTEKCDTSVCIWHAHMCFSRMGMTCRDQFAWNLSFWLQMTQWIIMFLGSLFFSFGKFIVEQNLVSYTL